MINKREILQEAMIHSQQLFTPDWQFTDRQLLEFCEAIVMADRRTRYQVDDEPTLD